MQHPTSSARTSERKQPKPLTEYPLAVAFARIEFYLRVVDAHFEKLAAAQHAHEDAVPREQ